MKVSVVISSLWTSEGKAKMLYDCMENLVGADEILALVNPIKAHIGFADAWNRIATLATGDYIVFVGDANYQTEGNLKEMCIPDTVTYPKLNGKFDALPWIFCVPKNIYEQIGLYDMRFNEGSHWEDTDFWRRIRANNIKIAPIEFVNFNKPVNGTSIRHIENSQGRIERNKQLYFEKWGDNDY
jgi:hypothetical protein